MKNKVHHYTPEELQFLRNGFQYMTVAELTAAFNARYGFALTISAIHSILVRQKIRRDRRILSGKKLSLSTEQIEFIRTNYRCLSLMELVAAFNARYPGTSKKQNQIQTFIHNHGIKSGRSGRFEKGRKSWNKGIKGYIGANRTSFKKGHMPKNLKPLGTERITKDGYIEIKVPEKNPYTKSPTRWKLKHRLVWEKEHGKIPKGMVVFFRDNDKTNCSPDNLILISRAEEIRLNQYRYGSIPEELRADTLVLVKVVARTGLLERTRNIGG